jgi:hypothetical protein
MEVMFDFVVDYIAKHQAIAPAEKFTLSDDDFEDFKQRVIKSGFTYDPVTEKKLDELVKLARKQPITWKTVNLLVEVKALVILGILLGTYFLSKYTGMFVIGAVFCALGFLVFFRCKKWSYYAITLGLAVGIWCAFRFGLGVSF